MRHINEVHDDIFKHHMDNPTHGMNCICMDSYIKELRSILGITDFETFMGQVPDHKFGEVLESPSYKAHKRWIYTLRTALRNS
jgi:hypothetical protein